MRNVNENKLLLIPQIGTKKSQNFIISRHCLMSECETSANLNKQLVFPPIEHIRLCRADIEDGVLLTYLLV